MAAVRVIDDLFLPTNCCDAGCSFGDCRTNAAPRWPRDKIEETAPRVKLTRWTRKKREVQGCMCGRAQLLEDEDIAGPAGITAKQFRTDFRVPYVPFFLGAIKSQYLESHSLYFLHQTSPESTKTVYSTRRTVRRVAIIHNPVRKISDRKPAFSPCLRMECTCGLDLFGENPNLNIGSIWTDVWITLVAFVKGITKIYVMDRNLKTCSSYDYLLLLLLTKQDRINEFMWHVDSKNTKMQMVVVSAGAPRGSRLKMYE